jgi:iron complex transport system substrate-binding protein
MTSSHTPRRIACLQPSATVILHTIGELERVVACTRYCADVVREVADGSRKILADSWTADAAEIIAARPDLVIAAVPYQVEAIGEILKAGARFLGLAPKSLADIYTDIATVAGTVGRADRGEAVISQMRGRIEQTRARVSGTVRPRVYCEEWGNPLITSQAWVAELVEAAGGEFLTAPARQITAEEILQLDPEVVIAAWCGAGDRVPLEKIVARRGWEQTRAVENRRVYCISDELLNTPAPTLLQGLDALAFAIHPEIFPHARGIRQITAIGYAPVVENGPVS